MSIAVRRGAAPRRRPSQGDRVARSGDNGGSRRGSLRDVSLDDKYVLEDGRILLTGLQGLVRLPLDQHRADSRRGLHTGTMISGYQGSPLGGFDKELTRNRELVEQHHVRHVPGLNEELGATSAWGSQLASQLPGREVRRRARHVVRQGARPRPRGRLAAPRQLRGRLAHRRRTGHRGRRPRLQVLHDPERLRVPSRQPPDARLLPRERAGGPRPRPSRARVLARVRPLVRLQDRHERGRRARHRHRFARARDARDADRRVERQAVRARAERQPARARLARHGAHAARAAHRAGAGLRARERAEPHRGRRSAPGSASSCPARPTTT